MSASVSCLKKAALSVLCLILTLALSPPVRVQAEETEEKVVRVGFGSSIFNHYDQFGRRAGYAYEYQLKVAAYAGWRYEYVQDSWANLFRMLQNGELDLLSDVSYTAARAETMLFPTLPMGTETYYVFASVGNTEITSENSASFNGKKVGVNQASIQESLFHDWARENGVEPEIVELSVPEDEAIRMLERGELDAYVTVDAFGDERAYVPVFKIGQSDYYFAVNKARPDLLKDLNAALSRLQDENRFYNQQMYAKYMSAAGTNAFLPKDAAEWLALRSPIRVGYRDNYLPFCDMDDRTGELTGALKEYLDYASHCLKNAEVRFEPVPYPTANAAVDAMKRGDVECVFPVNFSTYDSEIMDILETNPVMSTEIYAMTRTGNSAALSGQSVRVAVNEGNFNYDTFLKDCFPAWTAAYYSGAEDCFRAVTAGDADCVLISSYRINEAEETRQKYRLSLFPTGAVMGLSMAVRRSSPTLCFVLNKIENLTPDVTVNAWLASYTNPELNVTLAQFLRTNWPGVLLFITAVFSVIIVLLLQKIKLDRTAHEQQIQMERERMEAYKRESEQRRKIEAARQMAYTDPLTGVKSKHAWVEAEKAADQRIQDGTAPPFGVGVFDLNDLKKVNDTQGHEAGDRYIREACQLICGCFQKSEVYRIGGDEFSVLLENSDYANRETLLNTFNRRMEENQKRGGIVVAAGIASFDPASDKKFQSVFELADARMYQRKKALKEGRSDAKR